MVASKNGGKQIVRRYGIRRGDRTTAGGVVEGGTAGAELGGRLQAFEHDPVWCPRCKSMGRIVCTGPRIPAKGPDGREAALSEDWCVCGCERTPLLVASQFDAYVEV
ncbi:MULTISPECIES: PAAR domain-containing protein [unclassified Cupriavidus]|uniref:PAAR domain-containing protein n=1 Tax=unclassified Cupriavidus TaxID=2640874 RepID=UPI0010FA0476|nr:MULTISPECIES: PAAR domain-containing protein [unclassified Cupriavidus]MWL90357.1 PAAR domain-containing protein [Cupriavidus sp. SW-Y-13]